MKSFIKFLPKSCLNFSKNPHFTFSEIKFITRTFNIEKFKHLQLHDSASSSNFLKEKIKMKILENGPISISEYMSMCLYDPNYGYYTSKEKIFGQKGDFITAPESSQLFGEMIGIFLYKVIESFKFPKEVDLVEIGGGTGHLMTDIVNTLYQFNLLKCLNVIMIEKSPKLQKVQQETIFQALAKKGIYMQYIYDEKSKIQMFKSTNEDIPITFQWLDELDILVKSNQIKTFQSIKSKFEDVKRQMISVKEGKINANNFDKFVKSKQFQSSLDPTNQNPLIILNNELFDAYPIDVFTYKKNLGWCEKQVDLVKSTSNQEPNKLLLGNYNIDDNYIDKSSKVQILKDKRNQDSSLSNNETLFKFSYNPKSPKIKSILKPAETFKFMNINDNDSYEISVEGLNAMKQIAGLLNSRYFSAGLIIDYGEEHAFSDSLRAIRQQKQYKGDDILKYPGECDLSAYVNFKALKYIVDGYEHLKHKGVIHQGFFLQFMGIEDRAKILGNLITEKERVLLNRQKEWLCSEEHMGENFKFLYVTKKNLDPIYPFIDPIIQQIQDLMNSANNN